MKPENVNTKVELSGLVLDNPVIAASGTYGYGFEFNELYDINFLGSFSFKGTTKEPCPGNLTPRIAECSSGMINSVGLENPGIHSVVDEVLPRLSEIYKKKVIANISGFSVDEYVYCAKLLDSCDIVGILEINISCPNVHNGGMTFGTNPDSAAEVTRAVKKAVKKPVYIKLTPNVTDIAEIAVACEAAGADGINMINTLMGMRIDLKKRKPVIANKIGGFSGRAVFPVALRMVYQTASKIKIPIIGMGGISSAEDVLEMMMAGASAVQVGSENLRDPYACKKIIEALPGVMKKYGVDDINKIKGGAL